MRAKGFSYSRIADELHVSKGTLCNWNAELATDIARMKATELEALQEQYSLLKEGRITTLGRQLAVIQSEINRRGLSDTRIDKLLDLQLRYFRELKSEYVEPHHETKIGPKLNGRDICDQLQSVLIRYRAGEISESQARLEQTVLQTLLDAIEHTDLEVRLETLEALLQGR